MNLHSVIPKISIDLELILYGITLPVFEEARPVESSSFVLPKFQSAKHREKQVLVTRPPHPLPNNAFQARALNTGSGAQNVGGRHWKTRKPPTKCIFQVFL